MGPRHNSDRPTKSGIERPLGGACLAPWQRYPAAVALAAGDAIQLKLDSLGGRQLRLNALAQASQAQGRYGRQPWSGGDVSASPLVERDMNY
jgi:hypothetical protein